LADRGASLPGLRGAAKEATRRWPATHSRGLLDWCPCSRRRSLPAHARRSSLSHSFPPSHGGKSLAPSSARSSPPSSSGASCFRNGNPVKGHNLSGTALPMNLRRRDVSSDLVRCRTLASLRTHGFDHIVVGLPRLHSMVDVAGSSDRFRIELDHSCRAATDNED
jgi:hypothetical protein